MKPRLRIAATLLAAPLLCGDAAAEPTGPDSFTLVVVGDVGLNRSNYEVHPEGVNEGKSVLSWKEMAAKIAPLIDGDLNFMNLETVVTDRNDLPKGDKGQKTPYLFRTHPNGVRHLVDIGFNLISGANNHAWDYGETGVRETVKHLRALPKKVATTGIGLNLDEASAPAVVSHEGARIAFSSTGIVTNMLKFHRATEDKPGTTGYRYEEDWKLVTDRLRAARADLHLLSVHYGREKNIRSDAKQRDEWRAAVASGAADVVIGHHAHVVRGVEMHKGGLIFYGLGNFLIRGAANMGKRPQFRTCCDYGLLARVHFAKGGKGYRVAAVEAVPVFDMHRIARPLDPEAGRDRIWVLNALADELDDPGAGSRGVRFMPRKDGTGLYCVPGAADQGPPAIRSLCKGFEEPGEVPAAIRARVRAAPTGNGTKKGKRGKKKRRRNR